MPSFYQVGDLEMAIMLHAAVGLLRVTRIGHHLQPFKLIRMQINLHGRVTHRSAYRMLESAILEVEH
jgi:hypothetical protein